MSVTNENISCYCVQFRRAASAVSSFYEKALKPAGITLCQHTILRCVDSKGPCTVSALAQCVGLDRTTLVRTIKPLIEGGLIEDTSPAGSRNRRLCITKEGRRTLNIARPLWDDAQKKMEERVGPEKLKLIRSISQDFEEQAI